MNSPLPSQRRFLTGLINALSGTAPPSFTAPPEEQLHHLLLTLHVIFPSFLLPALDFLDRGLVTKVSWSPPPSLQPGSLERDAGEGEEGREGKEGREKGEKGEKGEVGRQEKEAGEERKGGPRKGEQEGHGKDRAIYIVKSLPPASGHRRGRKSNVLRPGSESRSYVVRLKAWNCTCASFAYDAYPPAQAVRSHLESAAEEATEMGFTTKGLGGLNLDGVKGGDLPCCKHLLAGLLAETWAGQEGFHVEERKVSRNEMMGIMANI